MIKKFKQFESTETETKLIPLRHIIAELIEESPLEDKDLYPQTKLVASNFCISGRPSESYLSEIVGKLKNSGMDVSELFI